jgi:hypothetical protein
VKYNTRLSQCSFVLYSGENVDSSIPRRISGSRREEVTTEPKKLHELPSLYDQIREDKMSRMCSTYWRYDNWTQYFVRKVLSGNIISKIEMLK